MTFTLYEAHERIDGGRKMKQAAFRPLESCAKGDSNLGCVDRRSSTITRSCNDHRDLRILDVRVHPFAYLYFSSVVAATWQQDSRLNGAEMSCSDSYEVLAKSTEIYGTHFCAGRARYSLLFFASGSPMVAVSGKDISRSGQLHVTGPIGPSASHLLPRTTVTS